MWLYPTFKIGMRISRNMDPQTMFPRSSSRPETGRSSRALPTGRPPTLAIASRSYLLAECPESPHPHKFGTIPEEWFRTHGHHTVRHRRDAWSGQILVCSMMHPRCAFVSLAMRRRRWLYWCRRRWLFASPSLDVCPLTRWADRAACQGRAESCPGARSPASTSDLSKCL
jgi:hypothetical protein